MSEGMLAAIAAVAAVLVALAQWFFSSRAASRQRDVELTQWGQEVIDVMAEIETASFPLSAETKYSTADLEKLSQRASALVDRGRLFFPKKPANGGNSGDDEGTRVAILDHVLKACYVARHLTFGRDGDRRTLRHHIWQSRRDFVGLLQNEVGGSMKRKIALVRVKLPKDPTRWDDPTRGLSFE